MIITNRIAADFPKPDAGNRIYYDERVKGFGLRVTAKGARTFILNYRTHSGTERRFTIGRFPTWTVANALRRAKDLRMTIDNGGDPQADKLNAKAARASARSAEKQRLSTQLRQTGETTLQTGELLKGYMTKAELASELRVTERSIGRYMAERNGIPSVTIGGKVYFKRESVIEWLEARERRPNPSRR